MMYRSKAQVRQPEETVTTTKGRDT